MGLWLGYRPGQGAPPTRRAPMLAGPTIRRRRRAPPPPTDAPRPAVPGPRRRSRPPGRAAPRHPVGRRDHRGRSPAAGGPPARTPQRPSRDGPAAQRPGAGAGPGRTTASFSTVRSEPAASGERVEPGRRPHPRGPPRGRRDRASAGQQLVPALGPPGGVVGVLGHRQLARPARGSRPPSRRAARTAAARPSSRPPTGRRRRPRCRPPRARRHPTDCRRRGGVGSGTPRGHGPERRPVAGGPWISRGSGW